MADDGETTTRSGRKPIISFKRKAIDTLKDLLSPKKKKTNPTKKASSKKAPTKTATAAKPKEVAGLTTAKNTPTNKTPSTGDSTPVASKDSSRQLSVVDVDDDEDSDDEVQVIEEEEEASEAELERLKEDWNTPIYAFFHPIPKIGYEKGCCYHEFKCFASGCSKSVRRFLDKKDAKSTSNLHKHAKICWGEETVKAATQAGDVESALSQRN
ncbi:hypothetical protein BDZ97DRAFT_1759839 [Flammula alnicola]|nr:hypothetical protein BDZ97DRAFT_1759839 [Flammula alnicola]